ncbi:MAG: hypothetical protein AMXMBFR13_03080 [Phycisphaerae bacterium]
MLIKGLGWMSAVAILAGTAYAGNQACCGEVKEIKESRKIVGTPIARANPCGQANPCGKANPCAKSSPCGEIKGNPSAPAACGPCEVKCETKCPKRKAVDADIERLRVINPECTTELCVDYKVEIEHSCPGEEFDMLLQVTCGDAVIYERLIPLNNGMPDGNDDELEFHGSFTDSLAQVYNDGSQSLRAKAFVYPRAGTILSGSPAGDVWSDSMNTPGKALDRETDRVRDDADDHGFATPLYTAGRVLYTPVGWVTGRPW